MIKIITLNVNGIRSAVRKGILPWLLHEDADVICLQELKAHAHDIEEIHQALPLYQCYTHCAEKKGYSGVAIYTKLKPTNVHNGLGFPLADNEGRHLRLEIGDLNIVSAYLPSGTSGEERQQCKFAFLKEYQEHLIRFQKTGRPFIICGDFNIAHTPMDLKNWRANQKHSGFLPEERAWLDFMIQEYGYVDVFRHLYPERIAYTWWSNRGRAYEKNVGWRIDYQFISKGFEHLATNASIYKDERFSDHAPLIVNYQLSPTATIDLI